MFIQNSLKFLNLAASVCPWALLIWQLSITWDTNPQYSHGYIIPFLCLLSLIKSPYSYSQWILVSETIFLFKGKLLFNSWSTCTHHPATALIIRGANSDWRLINFALFLATSAFIVSLAYDQGGWKRIRSILFPFSFSLIYTWPLATDLQFN